MTDTDTELPTYTFRKEVTTVQHTIDASKVKTLKDVRIIFETMQLNVWDDGTDKFAAIRHLYTDTDQTKPEDR